MKVNVDDFVDIVTDVLIISANWRILTLYVCMEHDRVSSSASLGKRGLFHQRFTYVLIEQLLSKFNFIH